VRRVFTVAGGYRRRAHGPARGRRRVRSAAPWRASRVASSAAPGATCGAGRSRREDTVGSVVQIALRVNGTRHEHDVEPRLLLVHYLRETLGLTGTNIGCDTTSCGACTVLLDGQSVKSCTVLAAQADGTEVTTIEGLAAADGTLHPV